jgi:hypothetical protein
MNRKVYEESLDTSLVRLVNDVLFFFTVTSCFFCDVVIYTQLCGLGLILERWFHKADQEIYVIRLREGNSCWTLAAQRRRAEEL